MNINEKQLKMMLMHEVQNNDTHCNRLFEILPKIEHLLPVSAQSVENLDIDDIARFALINERFCKLQDSIGEKVFRRILILLKEDIAHKSFIDILNKIEKLGILRSVEEWDKFREIRNDLVHEYPDDLKGMANNINAVVASAKDLCAYWKDLKKFIIDKIEEIK